MLDINPIKRDEKSANVSGVQDRGAGQNVPNQDQNQKPLKTVNADFLNKSKFASEPEFLESKGVSKTVFIFVLVATFLVLAMTGYLYFSKKTKVEELKTKEKVQADIEAKIAAPELAEVDALATRYSLGLSEISKLINKPVTYSLLFNELEKIIPTEVTLTSFDINEKQDYKISAKGTDLESTAKFMKSLEKSDYFSSVFLSSDQLSTAQDETSFTVSAQGTLSEKMLTPKAVSSSTSDQAKEGE